MRPIKIVAVPRDPNPYQELLYRAMRAHGTCVHYACTVTPSHSLNLVLLPLELLWFRIRGYSVFHIHWTFGFRFTGPVRSTMLLRASRLWFVLALRLARLCRFHIVWTAHNVLPHVPVFDDDIKARRALVAASDLVIAHAPSALDELRAMGAPPRRSAVIPHGPIVSEGLRKLPFPRPAERRTVLFFGRVASYKGVEDLLEVVGRLDTSLNLVIAGSCSDKSLRERLIAAATPQREVLLKLDYVPEPELPALFASVDVLVFPFRAVTSSGSVLLGLSSGRPAIVPDLPAFAGLPAGALIRYPPGKEGLARALAAVPSIPAETLVAKGMAARAAAEVIVDWEAIADRTFLALREIPSSRSLVAALRRICHL